MGEPSVGYTPLKTNDWTLKMMQNPRGISLGLDSCRCHDQFLLEGVYLFGIQVTPS